MTEDELVGWHYQLNGHEFEQASLIVQLVKNLPAVQETPVLFLGQEDPLEKGMANHSIILAWIILWIVEPGGL